MNYFYNIIVEKIKLMSSEMIAIIALSVGFVTNILMGGIWLGSIQSRVRALEDESKELKIGLRALNDKLQSFSELLGELKISSAENAAMLRTTLQNLVEVVREHGNEIKFIRDDINKR